MRTKYTEFVKLNEAGVFDALKNLFLTMFKNMSDEIKKPIENLTAKLDTTKKPEEMKKMIDDYLKIHRQTLVSSLDKADSLKTLHNAVKDNLTAIYACVDSSIKHLGDQKYSFTDLFKNSPEGIKKLFSKDEKNFNNNVINFSTQLLTDTGKQFKISKEDIEADMKAPEGKDVKIGQQNAINNATSGGTGTEAKTPETKTEVKPSGETGTHESYDYKLFEAVTDEDFKKLKDSIVKWFDNTLYKSITDNLVKGQGNPQLPVNSTVQDEIKNLKSKANKESVKKLVDSITGLDDPKKFAELRDYLVKTFGINAEDIGKF